MRLSRMSMHPQLALSLTRLWIGVAASSAGLATLHIGLTRLLTYVRLQAQAMVVMSCAPFALALGLSLLARPDRRRQPLSPGMLALLTELSVFACLVLASRLSLPGVFDLQLAAELPLLLYGVLVLTPFIAGGRLLVGPLARSPRFSAVLASAAFAGVSVASALAESFVHGAGTPGAVACSAGFFAVATTALTRKGTRGRAAVFSFSVAAAAVGVTGFTEFPAAKGKAVDTLVRFEGAAIPYSRWTLFERIDVLRFDPPRTQGGIASLGAGRAAERTPGHYLVARDGDISAAIYEWDGSPRSLSFLDHHLLRAPYLLLNRPDVLVLQGAGGIDVLAGLARGARSVRLVISNPVLREVGQEVFRDFNGDLLHDPRVEIAVSGGRALLRRPDSYDLITLHWGHTQSVLGLGMLDLSENQLHTREAVATYLDRLRPGGVLAISLLDEGRESEDEHRMRLLRTVLDVLRQKKAVDPAAHLAVMASPGSPRLLHLLVRAQPFDDQALAKLAGFAAAEGFVFGSAVRVPQVLAGRVLADDSGQVVRWPVATDDAPFFFDLDFFKQLFRAETYRELWQPRVAALSLPALLASVGVGGLIAFLVATWVGFRWLVDRRVPEIVAPLGSLRGSAWLFFFFAQGGAFSFFVLGVVQPLATAAGDALVGLERLLPALSLGCALGCLLYFRRRFLSAWVRLGVMVLMWLAVREGHPRWFEQIGSDYGASALSLLAGGLIGGFVPFGLHSLGRDVRWVPPALAAAFWGLGIGHSLGILMGARLGFSALPPAALYLTFLSIAAVHATHRFVRQRQRALGQRPSLDSDLPWVDA